LLNFEIKSTENKENETPKKEDEYAVFDLDFLGESPLLPVTAKDEKINEINSIIDVDLTPIPEPIKPVQEQRKKPTLDDIDEFSLFDNLKK
jgi:hypothetical protein